MAAAAVQVLPNDQAAHRRHIHRRRAVTAIETEGTTVTAAGGTGTETETGTGIETGNGIGIEMGEHLRRLQVQAQSDDE